jgi:hypothetical protein
MVPEKSELEGVTLSYHALVAVIQRVRVGSGDRVSSMRTAPHDARYAFIDEGEDKLSRRYDDRRHGRAPHAPGEQQSTRPRATDQEIQKWISRRHGFVPESAWIVHCKELFGLSAPGTSANENPCPTEKVAAIKQAFRHFGLL